MDRKIINPAWIEALESGEYTQCRRKIQDGDTYCCLGVAAKLEGRGVLYPSQSFTGLSGRQDDAAVYANDVLKWDFKQIAIWLRAGAPSVAIENAIKPCPRWAQEQGFPRMKTKYTGQDIFVPGTIPPKPKFDIAELNALLRQLMEERGITYMEVRL